MNYSNLNLRKYNLKTEFIEVYTKFFDKKQVSAYTPPDALQVQDSKSDIEQSYYQHVVPKNIRRDTINNELTIRGNAW